jgi:hypothetical protein
MKYSFLYGAFAICNLTLAAASGLAQGTAPVIFLSPSNRVAALGGSVTFSVNATGAPPLFYRWLKDGALMPGRTNRLLTLTSLAAADAGFYAAVVTNSFGSVTSTPASLTLTGAPPSIFLPATNVLLCASTTLSVAVVGSPQLHYQWRLNGQDLPGQNANSISIPGHPSNAGNYSVVVTNNYGAATSAIVTVELGPRIIEAPMSQDVLAGGQIYLRVTVDACVPRYQWRFNGGDLPGQTNYFLWLLRANLTDTGDYTVVVADSFRSVTSAVAHVEVQGQAPAITDEPDDQIDFQGTNVYFFVGYSGAPPPSLQWRFNGVNLAGATNALLGFPATPDRQGGYSVVLTNLLGSVTSRVATFSLRMEDLVPRIAPYGQPQSRALCPQTNAVFLGVSMANPPTIPLFFQWRKDGAALPGATDGFLWLEGAPSDVGDYTVVITNTYGAVTSEVATVSFAPAIFMHPSDALGIPDGGDAYFSVNIESCLPYEYQWHRNGINLLGATNYDLLVSPATLADAGDYRVIVRNSFGAVTSRVARLEIVQFPPEIESGFPLDLNVEMGQDAYFDVAYSAAPPPSFQWLFNGVDLPGETNQVLQFLTTSTNQTGGYSVVLSNVLGVVTSRVAQLTILVMPPEIEPGYPADTTVGVGDYANFFVNFQAVPYPTIQWRFNGMDIPGETNAYLQFLVMSTNQFGGYSVVLSNAFGVATSRVAQLTIFVSPPEITSQPADVTVNAGGNVNFWVGVSGSPPPNFQWRLNGVNIPDATNQFLNFTAGFTNQEGGYSVVVSNEVGSVTSRVATLDIILVEPRFITQPWSQIVLVEANPYFLATLSNNVPAYWQWQFNGQDLPGETNLYYLFLHNVNTNDSGDYRVIVWNDAGRATSVVATLTVRLPDTLDHWRWRRPAPQGNYLYSVTHDGTRFIAVGDTGAFVTSTNGLDWTEQHRVGDTTSRENLIAGNGVLVSLYGGRLQVSTDGMKWNNVGPEAQFYPGAVAFGAGRFVATGRTIDDISGETMTSVAVSTNGWDWQLQPPLTSSDLSALAYAGGRFLTSSPDWQESPTTRFFTSFDGESWGTSSTPIPVSFSDFAYGNGTYLAVSYSSSSVALSTDGTNWTVHPLSAAPGFSPFAVAFGAGRFAAVSYVYGNPTLASSTNGVDWVTVPGIATNGLWNITFAAGRFVAVGRFGAIVTSADGENWLEVNGGSTRNFRDITRGGGLYVAVGNEGMLLTSPDGATWTARVSDTTNNLRGVTFFQDHFVVVGEQDASGATVLTSDDGATWSRSTAPGNLFGLAHNGKRIVAVGDNGVVVTSLNGVTWSNVFSASRPNPAGNRDLNAVTWGGGRFVAVGRDGRTIVSSNGLDWASTSFSSPNLHGVAYGNSLYVAVARNGGIAYSTNATNWQSFRLNNADAFSDVGFGQGQFIAVGDEGMMFTSTNGTHWIPRIPSCQNDLRAVLYAEGSFYIAGDNETILQSRQTAPALRITWLPTPAPGRTRIELLGEVGRAYRLQVSEGLEQWTDLYAFTANREVTYFTERLSGTPRSRFYRLVSP